MSAPASPRCPTLQAQRSTVVVFRDDVGVRSEGFVTDPFRYLRRYQPVLAATRIVGDVDAGIPLIRLTPRVPAPEKLRVALYRTRGPARAAMAELSARSPVAVHAQFGVDAVQALPVARQLGVPLVTTFHGYDVLSSQAQLSTSYRGRAYLANRNRLAAQGALFLAVSDFLRSRLVELGFPRDRTRTHYLGVDVDALQPTNVGGAGLVFVGRLLPKKGPHLLLAAVGSLPPSLVRSVTIVGDGPMRRDLQRLADGLDVPVHFTGSLDRRGVSHHVANAAVLCAPSQGPSVADPWTEALGLVNLEAHALGVPVIASHVGGIPEAVRDGETGILVPPGDAQALADAIRRLLSDRELRRRMAIAARTHVVDNFDVRRQAAVLEEIYAGLR